MVDYKCKWHGNHLVKIGRFYPSSKLCSNCDHKHVDLKISDREWTCPDCGTRHDRNKNAATNLNVEGKRVLREERNVTIINPSTGGAPGCHAPGDRVRPVTTRAVVDEGRTHAL
ncbi:transposase [Candidatus Bathyarchaeota archaeon]|nr:transposase [Candidatus Bathyarchaeota archaeon]